MQSRGMSETFFAASVALIRRDDLLLIQRARAPWLGAWSLPGGRLEPGESTEDCARREIREELGLNAFALRPVRVMRIGEGGRARLQVFATQGFEGEIVPSDEITAWRWVRPEQIGGYKTTPGLADVVEAAMRMFDRS